MKIQLLLAGLLASLTLAADVPLAWDPSPTVGATNHTLYAHTSDLTEITRAEALVKIGVGTNLTATISDLKPGRWFFAVTASNSLGLESELSNVVEVEIPAPPSGLRTVFIQYGITLTNFVDTGFFRLRLP